MVQRRTFFQADPLIIFLKFGLYVMPLEPSRGGAMLKVAALIRRVQAKDIMVN